MLILRVLKVDLIVGAEALLAKTNWSGRERLDAATVSFVCVFIAFDG